MNALDKDEMKKIYINLTNTGQKSWTLYLNEYK